jgi:hypothetical protein
MNTGRRILIGLQVLLALLALSGCSSWKALKVPPAQYLAQRPRTLLRVNTRQEYRMKLYNARVSGDSLIGEASDLALIEWTGRAEHGRGTTVLPLDSVMYVEAHRFDAGKTVGLVLLGGVVAAAIVVVALFVGYSSD